MPSSEIKHILLEFVVVVVESALIAAQVLELDSSVLIINLMELDAYA